MAVSRFGALLPAMVTPFDADGALDADGAVRLARWLADNGSDGLVLAGTTGESPVLTDDEMSVLWETVAHAVTIPVVAGTSTNDTAHSVELTRRAASAGAAGILAVTPYYSRPSQQGIAAHFEAVAGASGLPVILYDIPIRSGRRIARETMLRLARDVRTIVGVKDATGDIAGAAQLIQEAPPGFELYSGDDPLTLPFMAVGAVGIISVAANWAPQEMAELVGLFAKGDVEGARAVNARLLASFAFETSDTFPNPLPAKAALRALGMPAGQCRLPMGPAPAELDDLACTVLAGLGRDLARADNALG